ncbi:unnamed protein product, partial [Staurois parvus]
DILPHKLQAALVQILEQRNDILYHDHNFTEEEVSLNTLVSEAFVWFFVEIVGHYSLHMYVNEKGESVTSKESLFASRTLPEAYANSLISLWKPRCLLDSHRIGSYEKALLKDFLRYEPVNT